MDYGLTSYTCLYKENMGYKNSRLAKKLLTVMPRGTQDNTIAKIPSTRKFQYNLLFMVNSV